MAQEINLTVDQGSNLSIEITVSDANGDLWDLSSYTVESQVRKNPYTNTAYTFVGSGAANGLLTLTMNAETSAAVPAGRYLYDVEIISVTNTTTRVQEGLIVFSPNITK